jgi:hypothetical protein
MALQSTPCYARFCLHPGIIRNPTGDELFKQILNLRESNHFIGLLEKAFPSKRVLKPINYTLKDVGSETKLRFESFIEELADSGLLSVDSFVEKKPYHADFCKYAVAYLLLGNEMSNPSNYSDVGDWYRYLFVKLLNGKSFKDFMENNVSFVTFNYDVSFDGFLIRSLLSQYDDCDYQSYLKKNPIIHVHGKTRGLEEKKIEEVLDLNGDDAFAKIKEFSQNIKFYFEKGSAEVIERARNELKSAHNVFFLGFGFLSDNMEKLKINWKNNVDGKAIDALFTTYYGTAFGLEEAEVMKVIEDNDVPYNRHYPPGDSRRAGLKLVDCDCLTLIKQNVNVFK